MGQGFMVAAAAEAALAGRSLPEIISMVADMQARTYLFGVVPTLKYLAIVHVRANEKANQFNTQFQQAVNYSGETLYAELTPGLSVHTGAGLVGASFVVSK
jgi:fatty acid-binding protein DegV